MPIWICARATPSARRRRPRCSPCPIAGRSKSSTPIPVPRSVTPSSRPCATARPRRSQSPTTDVPPDTTTLYLPERLTAMADFDRAELDEMVQRWVQANKDCEARRDWKPLADFYTADATYGWNYGPTEEFMA